MAGQDDVGLESPPSRRCDLGTVLKYFNYKPLYSVQ